MANGKKLREHRLAKTLVQDPCGVPPDAALLAGYLGAGRKEGTWRVYATPEFDEYVEFRERDVLHSETDDNAAGGKAYVWVRPKAKLRITRIESHRLQADFLQGAFTRELLARTPGPVSVKLDVSPREATGTSAWWCTWRILGCTREMLHCTAEFNTEHRTEDYSCEKSIHDACGQTGNPCTPACETNGPLCTVDCPTSLCD